MGFDSRIGSQFLNAGLGYGGSCFPKDVKALAFIAEEMGNDPMILKSVMATNDKRRGMAVERLSQMLGDLKGRTGGLLGLAFQPNTDDMRDAPSVDIVAGLRAAGAPVSGPKGAGHRTRRAAPAGVVSYLSC